MEEVVGNLTALVSSGPDWPYTLVWLHGDTHHVPLPKEGHLGILPQRGAEMTACGRISWKSTNSSSLAHKPPTL